MSKHAYLIIAHKNDYVFSTLIKLLDYEHNDIYIHMDAKNTSYPVDYIESLASKSNIYHCKRISVNWGAYSVVEATISLIDKAISTGKYAYYHLISGQDLPIKSNAYIHEFFNQHKQKEFVHFDSPIFTNYERVNIYHFTQEKDGRNPSFIGKILIKLQKIIKIKRNTNVNFQKGCNWFSITDNMARHIIEKKEEVKKIFRYTLIADEIFLQTLLINSSFVNNLYHAQFDNNYISVMRHIDWVRGNPYVFRLTDYNELMNSPCMFARKFDSSIDSDIIDKIAESIYQK